VVQGAQIGCTPYQTDVLFLLVGTNPLPNYVAAQLLAASEGTLYLLHTSKTFDVASRLAVQLQAVRNDLTLIPREIDRANGKRIEDKVADLARDVPASCSVGLHYTGGTKPMAVHAYHALRSAFPLGVSSYLDADQLDLVVRRGDDISQSFYVGQAVTVSLETLLALHGYEMKGPTAPVFPPALRDAILQVHLSRRGWDAWRRWLQTFGDKNSEPELPTQAEYPALAPVIRQFETLCSGTPTPEGVAHALGLKNDRLKSGAKAFVADWLEEVVLGAVESFAQELGLCAQMGIEPYKSGTEGEELDVLVMHGYQLFALSCMVTRRRQAAKDHLMEVFVRARQLGGDEARFALISLYPNHEGLQAEVSETWDAEGKIRVFGPAHLPNLAPYLQDWIETASRI
jgi:hypothetical protein